MKQTKLKSKYSHYMINRAMEDKIVQISEHTYMVNNKHIVINNKKNFRCDCKWFADNKGHTRYCHCCLGVLHLIDKEAFWKEIEKC